MNLFERIKYKLNEQPTDDNKTVNDSKVETNTNKNKKKGRYNKKQVDLTAAGRKRYYIDPKTGGITKGKETEAVRTWLSRSLGKGYTTNPKMKGKQSPEFIKGVADKIERMLKNPRAVGETIKKITKKYGFTPKVDPKTTPPLNVPKVDVPKVDVPKGFKPTSPGNYTIPKPNKSLLKTKGVLKTLKNMPNKKAVAVLATLGTVNFLKNRVKPKTKTKNDKPPVIVPPPVVKSKPKSLGTFSIRLGPGQFSNDSNK